MRPCYHRGGLNEMNGASMSFLDKLLNCSRSNQTLLCVGLDPDPEQMPGVGVLQFNMEIIDATSDLVCAYKPNLAFYEALGIEGLKALERTVAHIPSSIPVIGDAKRNDIASSSRAYAKSLFDVLGFDAVTVNPYLGYDSIAPFLEAPGRGVFVLCRTSNPGASDFQDTRCIPQGNGATAPPLFELVALKAAEWNTGGNVGLVVGATYPQQLKRVRELCPDLPLLIPGIGAQGGDLARTVEYGVDAKGERAIINSSRQVLYASKGADFGKAARRQALSLRDRINQHLASRR
jgi:orotidine-5'-phosphate decarboxylase